MTAANGSAVFLRADRGGAHACDAVKSVRYRSKGSGLRRFGTRGCVEHGRQIARYGGEFILTAVQERTSKLGSLKRNYGGIDTAKVRNQVAIDRLRADYEQGRSAAPNKT